MNRHNIPVNRIGANALITSLMWLHGEIQNSLYSASRDGESALAELAEFRLAEIDSLVSEILSKFPDATDWPIEAELRQ